MAPTVEADSFSSLTLLASNPPIDANAPIGRLAPLVLYIARVPGSRGAIEDFMVFEKLNPDKIRCISDSVETSRENRYGRRCSKFALLLARAWSKGRAVA